jgi:hypothetical protein
VMQKIGPPKLRPDLDFDADLKAFVILHLA